MIWAPQIGDRKLANMLVTSAAPPAYVKRQAVIESDASAASKKTTVQESRGI